MATFTLHNLKFCMLYFWKYNSSQVIVFYISEMKKYFVLYINFLLFLDLSIFKISYSIILTA